MPLIAMNREIGSLGKDVAQGLEQALGARVRHHEIIDHLADRARLRKSHVVSFLDGKQGLVERLTTDNLSLGILTADEIMSIAESGEPVILRGWGATALLQEVPHAVRVCISASRRTRVKRIADRLRLDDPAAAERIVDANDESARAVMRRHFHIDPLDVNEYDVALNTDRMRVDQCVDQVLKTVRLEQFAETAEARRRLKEIALCHHIRAAIRTSGATHSCRVRVTAGDGVVTLDGVVATQEQADACADVARRFKGALQVRSQLKVAAVPGRLQGEG